ncbi:ATP-grasp domain-containing protein [Desulfuromonas sp. DDH964]|uniref:ATP-grasp domain-containing protein n=1 Tax=Desulfuromonas sp. DDH964 TaxID=1823759 RepID=UPI00078BF7B9|nr:hypothetical protein [Desulfuromonas sp. DDH964]AMV73145.1 ATP-grasp domain-containing protein [Desulfuromonas sp. DDH964]
MRIGIHPDNMWGTSYSDRWAEFFRVRGVEVKFLDLLAPDFLEQARGCDGIMWRWFHIQEHKQSAKNILYLLETQLKKPVFPNTDTAWHFDEKIFQFHLLKTLEAPVPESWVFWDFAAASDWARQAAYPLVFKLTVGAGASNVLKLDNASEALRLCRKMFKQGVFPGTMNEFRSRIIPRKVRELKGCLTRPMSALAYLVAGKYPPLPAPWWKPEFSYSYFQEFLPGNSFDTRVSVIGNRAFAFRRMNRAGDFRASGSGKIDWDPARIDSRCLEIAFETSRKGHFQTMSYDFLYKEGQPVICEISYAFVDEAVYQCPGHWDAALNWHEGQMWPEEAQVIDFIEEINRLDRPR